MIPGTRCTDARSQLGLCCWAKCRLHPQLTRSWRKFAEQKPRPWPKGKLKPKPKPKRKIRSRTCRIRLPLFVIQPTLYVQLAAQSRRLPSCSVNEAVLSRTLDEIHIRVLMNEHRRVTCFGPFSLFF